MRRLDIRLSFLAALMGVLLASCSQDIHQTVVTTDNVTAVTHDITNATNISDEEKTLFNDAILRTDYQKYGKTVSQILADQRHVEAVEKQVVDDYNRGVDRQKAVAAAQTVALDNDLDIHPLAITVAKGGFDTGSMHIDEPFKDADTFSFSVLNKGNKPIQSFTARAELSNHGGQILFRGSLDDAKLLLPNSTQTLTVTVTDDYSAVPNTQLVRKTSAEDALLRYEVDRIEYADGTTAQRPD